MILFFGGELLFLLILIAIAFLYAMFDFFLGAINVLWILFGISSAIQTMLIGYHNHKKPLKTTVTQLTIDAARISLFFSTLKNVGERVQLQGGGVGKIFSVLVFILYLYFFSFPFMAGELCTYAHAKIGDYPVTISLFILSVVAIVAWIGYIL